MFRRSRARLNYGLFLWAICGIQAPGQCWQTADFPAPTNNEQQQSAQPLDPQLAAAAIHVPEGFQVQLIAHEPEVQNPIGLAWDGLGRLWIAENYTYSDRNQHFDFNLRDRVLVFSDDDQDGSYESRRVFTDAVQMLTSVEVGMGGVWLMCPPQLLFIPDTNADAEPDAPAQVILDGFDVAKENYHNFANGLKFGPDGWLYGRCGGSCPGRVGSPGTPLAERIALEGGIWRYHPVTKRFETLCHGTTNPWGHDWNSAGEGFFINTVNGHFWHLIPGAHYDRPFTLDPNPRVYQLMQMHADHLHFDAGQGWQSSRTGAASDLGGGHAHCGGMIYLGEQWPAIYRDRFFTLNLHGRRSNQERLVRSGSGYVAEHDQDFFFSDDPFFRGMEMSYGPDGSVFVLDWSDTGECHEHTGVHRTSGRIFRIAYMKSQLSSNTLLSHPNLYETPLQPLVEYQLQENEWYSRQARLEIARRMQQSSLRDDPSYPAAKAVLRDSMQQDLGAGAVRSLLTLHALQAITDDEWISLLSDRNEYVRIWALRMLTEQWPIDDCYGPTGTASRDEVHDERKAPANVRQSDSEQARQGIATQGIEDQVARLMGPMIRMANEDSSGLVRLTLASTMQRLPVGHRLTLATALCQREEDRDDPNLPLLVWYGLIPTAESHLESLAIFAGNCRWPLTQRLAARRIAEAISETPQGMATLLDHLTPTLSDASVENQLAGIHDGLRGWQRAPQPHRWPTIAEQLLSRNQPQIETHVRDLSVVFGDGRALAEIKSIVANPQAEIGLRRTALETLVTQSSDDIRDICLPLLGDARLNGTAIVGLARYDESQVAKAILQSYRRFRAPERPKVIAILTSRATFANALMDSIESSSILPSELTPFDIRQIRSLGDQKLNDRVAQLWGELRESSREKSERISQIKELLEDNTKSATINLQEGRRLFDQNCGKCHRLFGEGESIGPELTGANRSNLDYWLENIIDPSAVVSKSYCMSIVMLEDGRVLNGLMTNNTEATITLKTQTEIHIIDARTVEQIKPTAMSPMPDGLLDSLSEQQIKDLFAYLQHPQQVSISIDDANVSAPARTVDSPDSNE